MVEQDTIRLLRECDAGVKMGIASLDDVLPRVEHNKLENRLAKCKQEHQKLQHEINDFLDRYQDKGKNPNIFAKSMSHMKTTMKLGIHECDSTIASLMTDGCNMGVKSLNRYLNQYEAASEFSKDIAKRLIHLEEDLTQDIREFL